LGLATAMKVVLPKTLPGFIGRKWVVIGDDPGWSASVGQYWDKIPGASTAGIELAPFGTTNWAPYIAKLKASGAQGLLLAISFGVQYPTFMQQANAAGLFKQMKFVAPLGFPEDGMVPGYGETASNKTVAALLKTFVVWQYGAPWTYLIKSPMGKKYVDTYYSMFHSAPPAQANMQMDNTWRMLTAIKEAGPDNPKGIMADLRKPILSPYYTKPIGVQPGVGDTAGEAATTTVRRHVRKRREGDPAGVRGHPFSPGLRMQARVVAVTPALASASIEVDRSHW
jgi:ABC-type branched-subunit amino acid transport system substrate-binding protein